jgi:putative nucleotidyltransferase with HDIG domain
MDDFPVMPGVISQMADALAQPEIGIEDIVAIVENETGLTEEILRLAGSPYFGAYGPALSLQNAVIRLGMQQIFRIVVIASGRATLRHAVTGYDLPAGELWRHSVATALATQCLAEQLDVMRSETAFTAALLHDLGKLLIGNFMDVDVAAITALAEEHSISVEEAEREVIGADHAQIGAAMLEHWNLPEDIITVVRRHHDPSEAGRLSPVADLVHVGDIICMSMGIGIGRDGLYHRPSADAKLRHGIAQETMELVISRTQGSMQRLADLFSLPEEVACDGAEYPDC